MRQRTTTMRLAAHHHLDTKAIQNADSAGVDVRQARRVQLARRATRLIRLLAKLSELAPTVKRWILVGSLASAERIRAGISGAKCLTSLASQSSV